MAGIDGNQRQRWFMRLPPVQIIPADSIEYVNEPKERTSMSKSAVDSVTDAVSSVSEVGSLASDVRAQVLQDMADVKDALQQTKEFSKSLRDAGAKLRGVLGLQSNNPPGSN